MCPAGRKSSEEAVGLSAASDLHNRGLGAGEKDLQPFKWQKGEKRMDQGWGLASSSRSWGQDRNK